MTEDARIAGVIFPKNQTLASPASIPRFCQKCEVFSGPYIFCGGKVTNHDLQKKRRRIMETDEQWIQHFLKETSTELESKPTKEELTELSEGPFGVWTFRSPKSRSIRRFSVVQVTAGNVGTFPRATFYKAPLESIRFAEMVTMRIEYLFAEYERRAKELVQSQQ
jgi:hypothetical protein